MQIEITITRKRDMTPEEKELSKSQFVLGSDDQGKITERITTATLTEQQWQEVQKVIIAQA